MFVDPVPPGNERPDAYDFVQVFNNPIIHFSFTARNGTVVDCTIDRDIGVVTMRTNQYASAYNLIDFEEV
jgi:hypothetical protein